MKARKIAMIVTTLLVALLMGTGGIFDFLAGPEVMEGVRHLGYPDYFPRALGVAKILGTVAILAPVPRTLREWAYAGFTFDLIAAFVSHAAVGDGADQLAVPVIALGIVLASYFLRREAPSQTAPAVASSPG